MATGKIILGIIIPVIVALLINEVKNKYFKRSIQTMIYFPYFISWVILAGIMIDVLSPKTGIFNSFISMLGIKPIFFLGDPKWFQLTMILSDTWKSFGFGTVVYLAAITSIDPTLYESAVIDGANRMKQTLHITLPGISMIVILLSVLSLGNILNAGFDQIYNLSNPAVYDVGEIIDTMVYKTGILGGLFGPATAIGLLKSVVSFILISVAYLIAYKKYDYRVF
jgi:putative aldouronate transport system permease protein